MEKEQKELTIEESFNKLDAIINRMQASSLSLQETFDLYKEGIALVEQCSQKIDKIKCEIEIINGSQERSIDG